MCASADLAPGAETRLSVEVVVTATDLMKILDRHLRGRPVGGGDRRSLEAGLWTLKCEWAAGEVPGEPTYPGRRESPQPMKITSQREVHSYIQCTLSYE